MVRGRLAQEHGRGAWPRWLQGPSGREARLSSPSTHSSLHFPTIATFPTRGHEMRALESEHHGRESHSRVNSFQGACRLSLPRLAADVADGGGPMA